MTELIHTGFDILQDLMLPNSEKVFFAQKVGFAFSQPGWIDQFFKNEKERALAVAILKLPDAMHAVVQVHFQ